MFGAQSPINLGTMFAVIFALGTMLSLDVRRSSKNVVVRVVARQHMRVPVSILIVRLKGDVAAADVGVGLP